MTADARRYGKELGAALVAYAAALVGSTWAIDRADGAAWRFPVALLPMVPAVFALLAVVRQIGRMDEFQRRLQFEALAFAFGGRPC